MKRKIYWAFFAMSLLVSTMGRAQSWQPTSTSFSFTAKMFGASIEGSLKGFRGTIVFDPANLAASSISGSVDAATVFTDNSLRDRHLKEKKDFFEVAKYPQISMKSTKLEKTESGYIGTFNFQLKNVTRSVRIPFTFQENGSGAVMMGSVKINRNDWKFGGNTLGMSDEVKLDLKINLKKADS